MQPPPGSKAFTERVGGNRTEILVNPRRYRAGNRRPLGIDLKRLPNVLDVATAEDAVRAAR